MVGQVPTGNDTDRDWAASWQPRLECAERSSDDDGEFQRHSALVGYLSGDAGYDIASLYASLVQSGFHLHASAVLSGWLGQRHGESCHRSAGPDLRGRSLVHASETPLPWSFCVPDQSNISLGCDNLASSQLGFEQ